ncbi:MAG: MFS transporter [Opitutae bacterium]|nr:MFS transporter [Opitutae bacterium]
MPSGTSLYNKYLLFIAGLGGLLYGIDVGVIAGALPYLQATTSYTPGQLSTVVAAVLLGSVLSSLFAGALSDLFGRKKIMILAGICFVLSVPIICIPTTFETLVCGRILQGAAAGLIGVVVPLYLAECLTADKRGFGTGMFQFMLTVGLVFAALVGLGFAMHVDSVSATGSAEDIWAAKNFAWRAIFWTCAIPGLIFMLGSIFVSESPRWLFKKGAKDAALKALERSRGAEEARKEFDEMNAAGEEAEKEKGAEEKKADAPKDSIFKKKYVVPFVIAVVILACNQATGINSVLAYIVDILKQAGLDGSIANRGDLTIKILNMLMTIVAMILVDRKGRKFLLTVGTSGIIVGLLGVAALFTMSEKKMADYTKNIVPAEYSTLVAPAVAAPVAGEAGTEAVATDAGDNAAAEKGYDFKATFTPEKVLEITKSQDEFVPSQVKIVYTYGGFTGMKTVVVRPFEAIEGENPEHTAIRKATWEDALSVAVNREDTFEANKDSVIGEFFRSIHLNPFPDPSVIQGGEFQVEKVEIGPLPGSANGWLVTLCFAIFIAAYAVGPGVCVWLALSELMPTRIRSNGMSIALLINQFVSTVIAGTFLPVVGNYGYSTIFFFCAGCTVIYWITAVFFLPETKGRTLEEIEAHFEGKKKL